MINKNDPRLTAFVLGELDESERQEIQAAIDAQPELQTEVEQIQSASGQLEMFFGAEPAVSLTSEQHNQLKSELGEEAKVELADQDTVLPRQRVRRFWAVAASILGLIAIGWVCWEPMIEKVAEVYSASNPTEFSAPRKSDRDEPLLAAGGGAPPTENDPEMEEVISLVESETWKDELKAAENAEQASKILEGRLSELKNKIVEIDPSGNLDESQIELREQTVSRLVDEKNEVQRLYRDALAQNGGALNESERSIARGGMGFAIKDSGGSVSENLEFGLLQESFDGQTPPTDGFGLTGGINMTGSLDLDAIQNDDVAPPVILRQLSGDNGEITESLASHDRRTEEFDVHEKNSRPPEFLSGGEVPPPGQGKSAPPGFRFETRTRAVPRTRMIQQTKTRSVPVQRTRTETRTRKLADGTTEEYPVQVPYTGNVAQNYTVNVPVQENVTQSYQVLVPIDSSKSSGTSREITISGQTKEDFLLHESLTEADNELLWITKLGRSLNDSSDGEALRYNIENTISDASIQLRQVKTRFGSAHPNVVELKETIEFWKAYRKKAADAANAAVPVPADEIATAKSEVQSLLKHAEGKLQLLKDSIGDRKLNDKDVEQVKRIVQLKQTLKDLNENPLVGITTERLEILDGLLARSKKLLGVVQPPKKPKSWRRVKATSNTSRLMVGDKDELDMQAMQVNVQVDGFRARVLVDCFYYNDRDRQLEGNFKIRLPDDSSLYYFAFGQSAYDFTPEQPVAAEEFLGKNYQFVSLKPANIRRDRQEAWNNVKESRMVPREKAAFAYSQTVRRRVDPALVEWSGAGVFNARVFPLVQKKLHRIVIGYDVNLTQTDDGWTYELNLPEQTGQCHVDLNVTDVADTDWQLSFADQEDTKPVDWKSGPAVDGGQSSKRHRFSNPEWRSLRLSGERRDALVIRSDDDEKVPFFATRFKVELPEDARVSTDQQALFAVDTSLSSRPDKFNVWLDLLGATLNNNRDQLKKFAVVFFNVESHFWKTEYVENTEENVKALIEYCYTLGLEGATDVHGVMRTVAETKWLTEDDAKPDLFLLSDGAANWGETNLHLIQNEIVSANVGSLFAYQTGMNGTAISNLRFLASRTGGAVFSVAGEDEIAKASTAFRNRPWRLDSIEVDGATDLLTAGRVEWVYPGQALTVVGRGAIGGGNFQLNFSQGSKTKKLIVNPGAYVNSETASRLYGQVAVGQLERLGDKVFDVAAAYARYFRITGQTCSLLMLETEADYQRFNIKPEEDGFVVKSKNAGRVVATTLEKHAATIADPKSQLIGWIQRLEGMKQLGFKTPTALKIALDDMQVVAVDGRLNCKNHTLNDASKKYSIQLAETTGALNYDLIETEAIRRKTVSADDSLKAWSNLIERNAGDLVVAKDVAYTAMELDRPGAAYHLLKRSLQSRPFDSSSYTAIGQCLSQLGQADMAMIYYEIALASKFPNMGADFHKIAGTEYQSLLRKVVTGKLESAAKPFAEARLETLTKSKSSAGDLIVTMMWNTDSTDVDLHVTEPSGETCSYQNRRTKSGGQITVDITNGFGPEMYTMKTAAAGKYKISAKYFGGNQNRTSVPSKVHLTIYRDFGSSDETVSLETIRLSKVGQVQGISSVEIAK